MTTVFWPRRLRGFTLGPPRPYADRGPFAAVVSRHPYLYCVTCGEPLYEGHTEQHAGFYACCRCKTLVDVRRVDPR